MWEKPHIWSSEDTAGFKNQEIKHPDAPNATSENKPSELLKHMKRASFSRQRLHRTAAQSHVRCWCIAEQSCQAARLAGIIIPFWFYMPLMELIHILVNTNCLLLLYRVYPQLCYPLDCFPSILILLATFFLAIKNFTRPEYMRWLLSTTGSEPEGGKTQTDYWLAACELQEVRVGVHTQQQLQCEWVFTWLKMEI